MDSEGQPLVSSESSELDQDAKWDDDRLVWDKEELEKINKRRTKDNVIPILLRNEHQNLGIRANEHMTWTKCL